MNQEPLVSILMNCYNGEKYLREAVESVLAQTYQNWEVIFWDNQSTDRSAEIFKSYRDPRLKYFYAPTHTLLYEARNHAIEKTVGEIIAFLDVDDCWLPQKLEKQVSLFSDPEVGLVCGNYWLLDEQKKKQWQAFQKDLPRGWVLDDLLKSYFIGLLTLMIRRTALSGLDYPCDPRYHVMGDLDLTVRLSLKWKLDCVQEPVAVCRKHGNNELVRQRARHINELERWIAEMQNVTAVSSSPAFSWIKIHHAYQQAIYCLLLGEKRKAMRLTRQVPWGTLKLRLCVAIFLPNFIFKKLKGG